MAGSGKKDTRVDWVGVRASAQCYTWLANTVRAEVEHAYTRIHRFTHAAAAAAARTHARLLSPRSTTTTHFVVATHNASIGGTGGGAAAG